MRKTFIALASLIMSLVMSLSFLGGCNLITVDSERDMNQVVATVKISDDAPTDKIYKKDIVMSYLNYGYMYEYSYGYTREKVINFIVNQLITTRVYVQNAVLEFEEGAAPFDKVEKNTDITDKWDLERYLTDEEITDAKYSTVKDMNDLIKSYVEDSTDKVGDTLIGTVRTVPTDAANKEKELDNGEKITYIEKGVDTDSTPERREAFNEVIELLEANELLGDDYEGKIEDTTYYKETFEGYKETKLLEKFEKCITDDARANITYDDLIEKYRKNYEDQSEMDTAEFAEKLSAATAEDPVLVSTAQGYGFVYNLLLGASDAQTAKIEEIETTDIAERAKERKTILDKTVVKDLRSTWILSGYDFDGEKFTGDYTFAKDAKNSLPFQGATTLVNPIAAGEAEPEDYVKKYKVDSVTEYSLDGFVAMMEEYVYGKVQDPAESPADTILDTNVVYKRVNVASGVEEYDAKINELLFAFSTDDGSLNTYKGYVIDPVPVDGSETYMQEFADAGRELIKMGGNSYIMVATDYGYHVMFYSQAFDSNYDYPTLSEYLNYLMNVDDETGNDSYWTDKLQSDVLDLWDEDELDTDSFLYKFYNGIASTKVNAELTKKQNKLLNDHVYSTKGGVVRYPDTYADLLEA